MILNLTKQGDTMELTKTMNQAINNQINKELYSSYLYLSMAAYFDNQKLSGFSHWMKKQAKEEVEHAMKFFDYVSKNNGRVNLTQINEPKLEWTSPLDAFENALEHEKYVTSLINDLVNVAESEKDTQTQEFLQWYVDEQEEEEESVQKVIEILKNNSLEKANEELSSR